MDILIEPDKQTVYLETIYYLNYLDELELMKLRDRVEDKLESYYCKCGNEKLPESDFCKECI